MSRRVKVAMFQTARPIEIDADATVGATLGLDLFWADGTLVTPEDLGGGESEGNFPITAWSRIMEVPPNVVAVAALEDDGFVRRNSGAWSASPIVNADLSGASTTGLAEGANLYHTDERAQGAVGAIMEPAGDVGLIYDDATPRISAVLNNSNLASIAGLSAVDGDIMEYSPGGEWAATDSPRKLYLDGGNF